MQIIRIFLEKRKYSLSLSHTHTHMQNNQEQPAHHRVCTQLEGKLHIGPNNEVDNDTHLPNQ